MLQMPRRSVTRFFIPLIDVLTLLFCVFLVMPLAKSAGEDPSQNTAAELQKLQAELDRLHGLGADEPERLRKELEELREAKGSTLMDRIEVQVLEIDGSNGELSHRAKQGRVPIKSDGDLLRKVEDDRRRNGGRREVVYQILFPADPSSRYPTDQQQHVIEGWFRRNLIPYRFAVPGGGETEP
jgi:hypothetical protein